MNNITLTVNGKRHILPSKPSEMLAALLRERLNLTGTKVGCEEAECGTCTVLVDGEPVLSCIYPAARARWERNCHSGRLDTKRTTSRFAGSLYSTWRSAMRFLYPGPADDILCSTQTESGSKPGRDSLCVERYIMSLRRLSHD